MHGPMQNVFRDREEGGRALVSRLGKYAGSADVLVLGLPRGGVPVGSALAKGLGVALDVFIVRKLGVPGHEELAMGAIATGGIRVLNDDVLRSLHISSQMLEMATARERQELERRERFYRGERPAPTLRDHIVIVVDDGLATGATMRAAIAAVHLQQPARMIIAVPVAAVPSCEELRSEVDEIVCARTPEPFYGVGWWYENFVQLTDEEVRELLVRAWTL